MRTIQRQLVQIEAAVLPASVVIHLHDSAVKASTGVNKVAAQRYRSARET